VTAHDDPPPRPVSSAPIAIPHTELSDDALLGVIRAFVLREGTDYGERELTLEEKVANVRAQLDCGDAQILFDPDSESVDIVSTPGRGR